MNKKISSPIIRAIAAGTILVLLVFANSMMGYSYAAKKNTPVLNPSILPGPAPLPISPPEIPAPLPIPPPGLLGTLIVTTKVSGGNKNPSDFTITVSGNSPKPASFAGSSSGTTVTLKSGRYSVSASSVSGYTTTYSSGCSGSISGAQTIKCTVTNKYTSLPGSTTFLSVITNVDNTKGGTKKASDFTITVSGNSPKPSTFSGSSSGTSVGLKAGIYKVTASAISGYVATYSSGCSGTASGGLVKCTVTNQYTPPPGSTTFLSVVTKVDNTNGGTRKPSDFTITVSGNSPKPKSSSGSSLGTSVTLQPGKYSVSESAISGYTTTYSSGCSGTASGGVPIKCTITNQYTLVGSLTFLNVITKVDNSNGGTKKASDFTITVSGNSPKPSTFSGSSSGTSVRLSSGSYEVTENSIADYSTSYSSGCSGTATGGVPIKCTIANQYHGPSPPAPTNKPSNTTITSNSNSVYSIPSTFVKVDRFSTNYTIAGKISSINASRDLITSTIVDDFDKNPNIGYVVSNSSSINTASQPGLPNPFVSQSTINQKITNETQNAITAAYLTNPTGKIVEIKCTFGMILADYKCK
jgi:Prealbumin-like fold domain